MKHSFGSLLWLALTLSAAHAATLGYWRFEEGPADAFVYDNPGHYSADSSGRANHGYSYSLANSARYSTAIPSAVIPQTGAANQFSLYTGPGPGVRDLYTLGSINSTIFTSFTLEASVRFDGLGTRQTFVGKDDNFEPLASLSFQLIQDAGFENHVAIRAMDSTMTFRSVPTRDPVLSGRWYHFAAIADNATRTLTLLRFDSAAGAYVVENSAPWNGPLPQPRNWSWTLGRGFYNGQVVDPLNGCLDEVRISDAALATNHLLWSWSASPAVMITSQPANVTVDESATARFAVGVSGQPPFQYQWFRNDAPIPGATNAHHRIPAAQMTDHNARFSATVANVVQGQTHSVTSNPAVLTVRPDVVPPAVLRAQNLGEAHRLVVTFSEPVDPPTALAVTNYALTGGLTVTAATAGADARTVVLTTTPMTFGTTYMLTMNRVRDRSAARNEIAPGSQVACSFDYTPLEGAGSFLKPRPEPLGPCSRRTPLVVSEIHYHPSDRADGRNAEFIELFNSQPWPEDISGFRIAGSVDYTFPSNTVIAARGFIVVAAVPADVETIYGVSGVFGPFAQTNGLPNGAGTIRLRHPQNAILLEVNYSDDPPWPAPADGGGHSLVLARPSLGEDDARAWAASEVAGGTPGAGEGATPPAGGLGAVIINEVLAHPSEGQTDLVELFNYSTRAVDLTGCVLTDNAATNKFVFAPGSAIAPLGFLALDQSQLGFGLKAGGDTVWFKSPDGGRILDAARFGPQEEGVAWGRFPDGALQFSRLSNITPGAHNASPRRGGVGISEIMYHPISDDSDDEFVELHNHSAAPVDVSGWQVDGGISFSIPTNIVIPAGGHLVIARDAQRLLSRHPSLTAANAVGNFSGRLSDRGESLRLAKPILNVTTNNAGLPVPETVFVTLDEVEYRDGGRWGRWSDGGGSSLELVETRADPRRAPAWADSDESKQSGWKTIEATGVLNHGMGEADSLQILLLGVGECLVDDVEVIQNGANVVPNPDFEEGLTGWFPQGSHADSHLETADGFGSSRSLHVIATDRGDTGANRIRTTLLAPLTIGQSATIRARVKWLRGAPEILFRIRGNYLEATGNMLTTWALGTPGAVNSRAAMNTGPAITDVAHFPILPAAGEEVTVTARVADPDGLSGVTLHYRIDPDTNWTSSPMEYRGAGRFSALLPGRTAGVLVAFYLTASDAASSPLTRRFPTDAPERECLIRWGESASAGALGTYRLWMTAARLKEWTLREKLSNDPLDGTFVCGDFRVIYNMGAQFSGSPWHSQFYDTPTGHWCNYQLLMPGDDRFLGTTELRVVYPGNDADDDTAQREQTGQWICEQIGLPFNHQRYVHFFLNGIRRGAIMEDVQVPNSEVLDQFHPGEEGDLYKVSMWHEFEDNAVSYVVTPASIEKFTTTDGVKKLARYRWTFQKRAVQGSASDYTNFFALVEAANWPLHAVVSRLDALADTENWMRMYAFQHAVGNWDSWGNGNGQNVFLFQPNDGRARLLPFDADILLGLPYCDGPTTDLFKSTDPVLAALYTVPAYRRAYWRALLDLANGPFRSEKADPRLDSRHAGLTANGVAVNTPQSIKNYIAARRDYILSQAGAIASPFTVSGSTSISSRSNWVVLSGTAPVSVSAIHVNGQACDVTWASISNWTLRLPLQPGVPAWFVQGLDAQGAPIPDAHAVLNIEFAGVVEPPEGRVVVSEIMFAPPVPDAEYIELFNASTNTAYDLTGWRINGLDYTFPNGAMLLPGNHLVLAKNRIAFWDAYGMAVPVFAEFGGNLQSDGETLTLLRPGSSEPEDLVVDRVTYAAAAPWPSGAAGPGAALQLIDPVQDNSRVCNWSDNAREWRFFSYTGNSAFSPRWRLSFYFDNGGELLLDDISLVPGSVTGVGQNYIANGDFESALAPAWTATSLASQSAITHSDAHSGTSSLRLLIEPGSPSANYFYQYLTNVVPSGPTANQTYTLSFWHLSGGSGTLNAYVNASFRTHLALGSGTSAARFTPGAPNSVAAVLPPLPPLYLNEAQPVNLGGPRDNFGEAEPWIEIHNAGTAAVSLADCYLAAQFTNLLQWRFPANAVIGPGDHLLVWADGQTNQANGTHCHANFRLDPGAGSLALTWAAASAPLVLDFFRYDPIEAGDSYGAWPEAQTSYRRRFSYPTPGAANDPALPPEQVFINEWMASNTRTLANPAGGQYDDWFELYNPAATPVDLAGWSLANSLTNAGQSIVPVGYSVPANGYLLVWADGRPERNSTNHSDLHVDFKLSKDGEAIALFAPGGRLVDHVTFGPQGSDLSQGRYPEGSAWVRFLAEPTPRRENAFIPPAPRLSGIAIAAETVTLTFSTTPGLSYQIEFKDDFAESHWTALGSPMTAPANSSSMVFTLDATGQRFYRVTVR